MRIERRNFDSSEWTSLVSRELSPDDSRYDQLNPLSLRIIGHYGRVDSFVLNYWYRITFTPRELKTLLSKHLSKENLSNLEKKLWEIVFDLWESRLKKLDRKREANTE